MYKVPTGALAMNRLFVSAALVWGVATGTTANAQIVDDVTFDCTGAINQIVETPDGVRGTGLVNLTVDLSNGAEWRSSGVIVVELPPAAAERNNPRIRLNRCIGEGKLEATLTGNVKGVDIYRLSLQPSRIRIRAGNSRISDPTRVEFSSSAGGSPNI
jgi:hypothetical protein